MPKKEKMSWTHTKGRSEAADTTIRRYIETHDPAQEQVRDEFAEAQVISKQEPGEILHQQEKQEEEAELSGGDLDASWDTGSSGEEAVGGSSPTPDQDNVDDVGEAAGLTFQDTEEIRGEKLTARDDRRWELDPASSEDYEERSKNL